MVRRLTVVTAGSLMMALAATPVSDVRAQEKPQQPTPTWGGAAGQTSANQRATAEVRSDGKFIVDVTQDNLFEMQLGQTAQSRAQNSAVKQFGQRMVTDHNRMQDQWSALLTKHGIEYRTTLRPEQEQQMKQLEQLSGREFDRAYMSLMIQGHENDVRKFQNEGRQARSAEVRQIVEANLPILEQHVTLARQTGSQVDAAAGPVVAGPTPPPTQNNPVVANASVRADSAFIRNVVNDNLLEVRLAQAAEKRAENSAVKQFAQRMVTDHLRLQEQWTGMASRNGMRIEPKLDPSIAEEANRVGRKSGKEFDRDYMRLMILGHASTAAAFESQSRSANSAEVRQLAAASLPSIQDHARMAKEVGSQVGADTTTGPGFTGDVADADMRKDREFIRDAVADHFLETRLGELAERRARNSEVKEFGRRMVADHNRLQEQWIGLASRSGRPFKPGMGRLHQQKLDRLKDVSDREFDRAYMTLVIQNHQDYLSYWRKEGRAAQSSTVRGLVNDGLPTLEQHWSMARRIGGEVGAKVVLDDSRNADSHWKN